MGFLKTTCHLGTDLQKEVTKARCVDTWNCVWLQLLGIPGQMGATQTGRKAAMPKGPIPNK